MGTRQVRFTVVLAAFALLAGACGGTDSGGGDGGTAAITIRATGTGQQREAENDRSQPESSTKHGIAFRWFRLATGT